MKLTVWTFKFGSDWIRGDLDRSERQLPSGGILFWEWWSFPFLSLFHGGMDGFFILLHLSYCLHTPVGRDAPLSGLNAPWMCVYVCQILTVSISHTRTHAVINAELGEDQCCQTLLKHKLSTKKPTAFVFLSLLVPLFEVCTRLPLFKLLVSIPTSNPSILSHFLPYSFVKGIFFPPLASNVHPFIHPSIVCFDDRLM